MYPWYEVVSICTILYGSFLFRCDLGQISLRLLVSFVQYLRRLPFIQALHSMQRVEPISHRILDASCYEPPGVHATCNALDDGGYNTYSISADKRVVPGGCALAKPVGLSKSDQEHWCSRRSFTVNRWILFRLDVGD